MIKIDIGAEFTKLSTLASKELADSVRNLLTDLKYDPRDENEKIDKMLAALRGLVVMIPEQEK